MPDQREGAWGWVEVVERRVVFPSNWEKIWLPDGEVVSVAYINQDTEEIHFEGSSLGSLRQSCTCDGLYLSKDGSGQDGYRLELDTPENPIGHRFWSVHRGEKTIPVQKAPPIQEGLPPDCQVLTPEGCRLLNTLQPGDKVLVWNDSLGKLVERNLLSFSRNGS
jgi:hypothetical protein